MMKTKTLKLFSGLVCALALAVPQHSAQAAGTKTITFASGTNWRVYKSDPAIGPAKSLGLAQAVCLTTTIPVTCPTGALIFDYPAGPASWDADLTPISGAVWVWAPKITAQSLATNPSAVYFSKKIKVSGTPLEASLSVALDSFGGSPPHLVEPLNSSFVNDTGRMK
jgi:hypothetical protein